MTSAEALVTVMGVLSTTFGKEVSPAMMRGYEIGLEDLTADELGTACKRALRECRFMPSPAELIALCGRGGAKTMAYRTAEAWEAVRAAMDRHDYTTSVDFGPLVNAVLRNLGGWVALCDRSVPDLVWVRKDFERLYEAFAEKETAALRGDYLTGAFGGPPVRIAIGGVVPKRQLSEQGGPSQDSIRRVIRDLGDGASKEPQ